MENLYIGVDVGGTTINIGVVTMEGEIFGKTSLKTTDYIGDNDAMLDAIITGILSLTEKLGIDERDIQSIGLGFPGTVDSKKGEVIFAPNLHMKNVQVKQPLSQAFTCSIYLGQDSRVSAWGEYCIGQKKAVKNMASITIGTGIGCGLIINGNIYHGACNTAGEFGHQVIDPKGPLCNCGKRGCVETYSGGLAIVRAGAEIGENLSVKDIYDLALNGNRTALMITDRVVQSPGIGIVNLVNLLSLELITISGGISNAPDELLLNPLKKYVEEHAYVGIANKVKIVHSALGDNAPLVGAALQDKSTEY